MNETKLQVRPEIVQLAAEITNAPRAILTAEEERKIDDLIGDTVNGIARGDMAGRLKQELTSVVDFFKRISYKKLGKTVEKAAIDDLIMAATATLPFTVFKGICSMLAQKEPLRTAREKIRPEVLENSALFEQYRRHGDNEGYVKQTLAEKGYTDKDIDTMLEFSYSIMNANDVISLTSRNAFDEGLVKRLGLDEGLSEIENIVAPRLDKAGFDMTDFKYYWRGHWSTPGLAQTFEMLRRGIIDDKMANDLFDLNDIPPGLRKKLLDLSKTPLNKLDLRRLYDVNIIDNRNDLIPEYVKLGYTYENAKKLSILAEKLKAQRKISHKAIQEKTASNILTSYSLQMLDRKETIKLLIEIKYTEDDADFLISQQDFENERDRLMLLVNAYKKAYLAGIYDDKSAAVLLGKLNLPSKLTDTMLDAWQIEKLHRAERPTKGELLSFYSHGIIDKARCEAELKLYGYSLEYITWYMTAAKLPKTETKGTTHAGPAVQP